MKKGIKKIAIVGGGASGIFAALRCAELAHINKTKLEIKVFELSARFLLKVKISGGGRCNVTHNIFTLDEFCQNYPRGRKELISPFKQFHSLDIIAWFKKRGVLLKHEADGRMFPVSNKSSTIIDCFMHEAKNYNIKLLSKSKVTGISKKVNSFELTINDELFRADKVLLATGSQPIGYKLAKGLGHTITELAPSLFSFIIKDILLKDLSGTAFVNSTLVLKIPGCKDFIQKGPILITHWGISGPALLKLSAWAAREMLHANYCARLRVNWLGFSKLEEVEQLLIKIQLKSNKEYIKSIKPQELSKNFWLKVLEKAQINTQKKWADISKKERREISSILFASEFDVVGKNRFKQEFVECGGINLKEINFKTMESKLCSGLYFSGEIMDIDGITGGFNFQNAWTSGYISGSNLAHLT